jgi:hypothetical protein
MATQAAQQILDDAIDLAGMSVVTTTRTTLTPRNGLIYNPDTLAAAVPIWFHPLNDGRYMALLAQCWTGATVGTVGPQSYTAHTTVTIPSTVIINPATGSTGPVVPLPSQLPGTRVVEGAASRFDNLYTVGTLDGVAHVQWHRVVGTALLLGGEEIIPGVVASGVNFRRGCYVSGDYLYVFGDDDAGQVYLARKRWGRIGFNDRTPTYTWEYLTAKGWLPSADELAPLKDTTGAIITTVGPVSYAHYRDRALLVVVHKDVSGVRSAQGYVARDVDSRWRPLSFVGPSLGDDSTYLGAGLQLQDQLNPNLSTVPTGAFTAFPAVSSILSSVDGEDAIVTGWVSWPLSR